MGSPVRGQCPGHGVDGALGARVGHSAERTAQAGCRGDVDDRPATAFDHGRTKSQGEHEQRSDVDREDQVEVLLRQILGFAPHRDAGVVDQDVYPIHGLENPLCEFGTCPGRCEIGFDNDRIVREIGCHAVEIRDGAPGEYHPGTGGIQRPCTGFADTSCGAGDDGELAVQIVHVASRSG